MARLHIVIVDSDPTVALVTQRGLQRMFADTITVDIAASPSEAWASCVGGHVDIVIVDPNPENSPAAALVKSLHTMHPSIPVLVLTAYDTPRLRMQMRALGIQHYLAKPVELRDLEQLVRSVVAHTTERRAAS